MQQLAEQFEAKLSLREAARSYVAAYKADPAMTQVGPDVDSDDEHCVLTVRCGAAWTKVRCSRSAAAICPFLYTAVANQ